MNNILIKLDNLDISLFNNKPLRFFILASLILINFLLLHKYNIFVGDDGVLAPLISGYYYFNLEQSIMCPEWEVHKWYTSILGKFYVWYFSFFTFLTDTLTLNFRWINVGSFFLFISSFIFFYNSIKKSNLIFKLSIIFLTLEPFIVLSHSIRHDILVFAGNLILIYVILSEKINLLKYCLFFIGLIFITIHPSGIPLMAAILVYIIFNFNIKEIIIFILLILSAICFYLYNNNILNPDNIYSLIKIRYESSFLYNDSYILTIYDYFYYSKFKRHLIEIIFFIIYIFSFINFNKFSKKLKFFSCFPLIYLGVFILLNYFNISYFKHLYAVILIYFGLYSIEFTNIKNINIYSSIVVSPFVFLYIALSLIFIPHNSWKLLEDNFYLFDQYLNEKDIYAAPLYFSFFKPKKINNYLPITHIDELGSG